MEPVLRTALQWIGLLLVAMVAPATAGEPVIQRIWDVDDRTLARDEMPGPGSLTARLGAGIDVAEKVLRLAPEAQKTSQLLTEHSRRLLDTAKGHEDFARRSKLRQDHWYPQLADSLFADDAMAVAMVVYVPRPAKQAKTVDAIYLLRKDSWQVTLDIGTEVAATSSLVAKAQLDKLQAAAGKRLKELSNLVSRPLAAPLPIHGTWASSFAQTSVFLCLYENGEATFISTHPGSVGYDGLSYHLSDGQIVVETRFGPLRLKTLAAPARTGEPPRPPWLIVEGNHPLLPARKNEGFRLNPVTQGDWPLKRPAGDGK